MKSFSEFMALSDLSPVKVGKSVKKVPKGMSEFQAIWNQVVKSSQECADFFGEVSNQMIANGNPRAISFDPANKKIRKKSQKKNASLRGPLKKMPEQARRVESLIEQLSRASTIIKDD